MSAAASLPDAFNEIKAEFAKANPGINLTMNYAASGTLLSQMEKGAPVDVFRLGRPEDHDQAAEKKLIDAATPGNLVRNDLVLAVPADNPPRSRTSPAWPPPRPSASPIGNPDSVPVGR